MNNHNEKPSIDPSITLPGLVILLVLSFSFFFVDLSNSTYLSEVFDFITGVFGSVYLIYVFLILGILLYFAFSKVGKIKLGEGKPQYSTLSWISMLFCACIGSSILYWGMIEWGYYMNAPPFGIASMSTAAAEWSVAYTMFHWGISGWATYCLAAVIIAYYFFVKKIPVFRISISCGLFGTKRKLFWGKVVDVFVIVGLCSGVAVGVSIGTPMIAQGLYELFGIVPSTQGNVIIALLWAVLFSATTVIGMDKGIKTLSNINSIIAIGFILYVLLCGSTSFIINNTTNSIGMMLQNFLQMSFYTDPVGKTGFAQDWTIFYWAWWISYVPVMGLFIAKISRGRTISQVIFGTTILGSLGCWAFQAVLGGYALDLQLTGKLDTVATLNAGGDYAAIMDLLNTLPFPSIVIGVFIVLAFIFLATTCDSSAYILATLSTKKISIYEEPSKKSRLLWSVAIIIWPIILILVGGMDVVKLCSVIGSIPLVFIIAMMVYRFLKDVKENITTK